MKIRLQDGTMLECIDIYGSKEYIQGENRETLEIHIDPSKESFERIESSLSEENTERLYIVDSDKESLHEHYKIRIELSLKKVELFPDTPEEKAVYEDRYVVKLAQLTHLERQLRQQENDIATLYYLAMRGGNK